MLSPQAYFVVLFVVCAYAFVRGRTDERAVAADVRAASSAAVLVAPPKAGAASHHEAGRVLVDVGAFVAFTLVALKSERFWPLWVAGLQLTTLMSHAFKVGRLDLMPQAYAAAARFWVYPIFLIIVIGTWRSHRRRMEERRQPATA